MGKIKLLEKYKPYLFCLNDSLKTTDDDRVAMKEYLESRFEKPCAFEKNIE